MKNFPLYDTLIKDLPDKDLTQKQKKDFIEKIQEINDKGYELLYMLIKVYSIKEGNTNHIPYDGKYIIKNSLQFDLDDFPLRLRQLLYKFINLHIKTMREEIRLV